MNTILTESPDKAADVIRQGGLTAFPTETVYGLGADVFNEEAVGRIFEAKGRPSDNPLIAHIGDLEQLSELAEEVGESAHKLIAAFFPGPLTLVLRKHPRVPAIAAAGLDTIGVRMPRLPLANEFLRACGTPVSAPSANLSGRPSPTTWEAVLEDLNGRIDCLLRGGPTEIGLESTVVDCSGPDPILLRSGSVTLTHLQSVVPSTTALAHGSTAVRRSPGLRHRHYSPRATVVIVHTPPAQIPHSSAYIGLDAPPNAEEKRIKVAHSVEEYARVMFEFFRECDRGGVDTIFCQSVAELGIGSALMDRLRRASDVN